MPSLLVYQLYECIIVLFEMFILYTYIGTFFEKKRSLKKFLFTYGLFSLGSMVLSLFFRELPLLALYTFLGLMFIILFLYKSKLATAFFIATFFIMIAIVSDGVCSAIIELTGGININETMSYGLPRVLFVAVAKLMQICIVKIINVLVKWRKETDQKVSIKQALPLFVSQIMSVILIYQLIIIGLYESEKFGLPIILSAISVLYINGIIFWYFDVIKASYENKVIVEAAELKLSLQKQYYEMMEVFQKDTDMIWHDINKHKDYIISLINSNNVVEAKSYFNELEINHRLISKVIISSNPVLSTLISVEKQKAELANIQVRLDIHMKEELKVSASDLGVIIGNLFENAIEACTCLPLDSEKYISFSIWQKDDLTLLEIENPYKADLCKKKTERVRGYGLKNIERVVNKYKWHFEVDASDHLFKVKIVMF